MSNSNPSPVRSAVSMTWLGSVLYVAAGLVFLVSIASALMAPSVWMTLLEIVLALLLAGLGRTVESLHTLHSRLEAIESRLSQAGK